MNDLDQGAGAAPPVFLERQSYRRRRLLDAARLMPVLGALLFALPLLWVDVDAAQVAGDGSEPVRMSRAIIFVFVVWTGLILSSLLFGMSARNWAQSDPQAPPPGPG